MAASLEDLDRRVTALERAHNDSTESLKWMLTKLARIQAVQDEHTLRLDRLETKVDAIPRAVAELLSEMEGRSDQKMALMEDRLLKAIRGGSG